jgi:acetoin utilization deacetylase AcuC-like enzyme
MMRLELPYSKELIEASRICVRGTMECLKHSLSLGVSVHLGGGFHHAFAGHGEGFCVFNDIAVAVRYIMKENMAKRIMIVDCDLHQGNGTADIFKDEKNVFTFSIHQEYNYPQVKPPSDLDIGLDDGTGDEQYISSLKEHLPVIIEDFKPDILLYVAGADPYIDDQLGGLDLSISGLKKRDKYIFSLCKENDVRAACVLAGGYALDIEDTIQIHCNMIKSAKELLV